MKHSLAEKVKNDQSLSEEERTKKLGDIMALSEEETKKLYNQ